MINQGAGITVTKFLVVESGTYDIQYRRPYQTELNCDVQQMVSQRYQNVKGDLASGTILSGVAGMFLKPQMEAEDPNGIQIEYGWHQRRYRVLMEVEARSQNGFVTREVVMGYSDYVDPSLTGHIDPDMVFHINTINVLRDWQQQTPDGLMPMSGIANSSHVLSNEVFTGHGGQRHHSVRPQDVFSFISQAAIDTDTPRDQIYDGRTTLTQVPVKSERKNGVATAYANRVLSAYNMAHKSGAAQGSTGFDTISEAQSMVMESEAQQDFLLRALRDYRNAPMISKHFTLREIHGLSPHTVPGLTPRHDSVLHVVRTTEPMRASMYQAGQSEGWHKATPTTRIATILAHEVPSLLMENMFTRAIIQASNRVHHDGRISVVLSNYESFSNMDLSSHVQVVEMRLAHETMMAISENNHIDFDLDMVVQLDGESRFTISVQGAPHVEYVVPSFADSLLAPIITTTSQRAYDIANDFRDLGNIVSDAQTQVPLMNGAVYMSNTNRSF